MLFYRVFYFVDIDKIYGKIIFKFDEIFVDVLDVWRIVDVLLFNIGYWWSYIGFL